MDRQWTRLVRSAYRLLSQDGRVWRARVYSNTLRFSTQIRTSVGRAWSTPWSHIIIPKGRNSERRRTSYFSYRWTLRRSRWIGEHAAFWWGRNQEATCRNQSVSSRNLEEASWVDTKRKRANGDVWLGFHSARIFLPWKWLFRPLFRTLTSHFNI